MDMDRQRKGLPSLNTGTSTVATHWPELGPTKISETDVRLDWKARVWELKPSAVRMPSGLPGWAKVVSNNLPLASDTMTQVSPLTSPTRRASSSNTARSSAVSSGDLLKTSARTT